MFEVKDLPAFIKQAQTDPVFLTELEAWVNWVVMDTLGALVKFGLPGLIVLAGLGYLVA